MPDNDIFVSTSIKLVQIDVHNLQTGMYVSKLDRPWLESSFLFQGFRLKNEADIKEVQQQCHYVFIDVNKQNKNNDSKPSTIKDKKPSKKSGFNQEFSTAEQLYQKTSDLIKSLMHDIALNKAIDVNTAQTAVSECVKSIINSPDALMWLTQLRDRDEYTSQHSMNVCIFSIALGWQLGLPETELEDIGLCGMMHDIGKIKVPLQILNKPGRLDPNELATMQSHTSLGSMLLKTSQNIPDCVVDAAYAHHERLDGSGYPRGLTGEQITPYTQIVSIADVYDAISSERTYKKGQTHMEAIHFLTESSDSLFDSKLVIKFIESMGVYPPGSIVEMTNGEIAVVAESNPKKKLRPKVIMLLNENKQPVKPRLVDLTQIDVDASSNTHGETVLILNC